VRPLRATLDPNPHVALAAVDALGGGCDDRGAATDSLIRLAATPVAAVPARPKGGTSWHRRAHALLALSRLSPTTAIPLLRQDALHPVWQVRLYVARAALVVRDTLTLSSLAFDANGNVREAALAGISATVGHAADKVYLAALSALDYQVVLQAAQALRGAPAPDSVVPALFTALERLTAERRENARDPRVAPVERIGELGNERQAQRLAPYSPTSIDAGGAGGDDHGALDTASICGGAAPAAAVDRRGRSGDRKRPAAAGARRRGAGAGSSSCGCFQTKPRSRWPASSSWCERATTPGAPFIGSSRPS
jgi:hypothetical protein